jgi:hypothetical protein
MAKSGFLCWEKKWEGGVIIGMYDILVRWGILHMIETFVFRYVIDQTLM